MKKEDWIKKHPIWGGVIGVVLFFVLVSLFSGGDNSSTTNTQSNQNAVTNLISKSSAIEMMEVAFIGGNSQEEIKTLIDATIRLYSLSITEENYQRLGSVLVSLRKETGVSEMDILICMKAMDYKNTIGENIAPEKAITDSAAICSATLSF